MKPENKEVKKDSKFKVWMNNKLIPFFGKVSTQRHLLGIRNGIMASLPFILVGSVFLIISSIPIGSGSDQVLSSKFPEELKVAFDLINRFTFGLMALYMSIGIGSELARLSRISLTQGAVIGAMGYIMWILPLAVSVKALNEEQAKQLQDWLETIDPKHKDWMQGIIGDWNMFKGGLWINIKDLGGSTAFVAIVSSTITVEIYRVCLKYRITIRMPKQVPDAVSNSFSALIPILFGALIIGFIRYIVGFDLANFLKDALAPLGNFLTTNLAGALIIIFLIVFLWLNKVYGGQKVDKFNKLC